MARMFESCQNGGGTGSSQSSGGPRCTDVAEKLAQLFGWRQTYKVEKLQRSLAESVTRRLQQEQRQCKDGVEKGSSDSWVVVHNLQSQSDGGILDPDDRLNDVADDREQIIANFEDGDGQHHGGGDGASGSSVGTGSPDIFQSEAHKYGGFPRADIEVTVTGEQIASGLITAPLQVRRGSEPALNQLVPGSGTTAGGAGPPPASSQDPSKRWSATPIIVDDVEENKERRPHRKDSRTSRIANGYLSSEWCQEHEEEDRSAFSRFVRDGSNRLSMQFLSDNAGGFRWADAAERAAVVAVSQSKSLPRDHRRKEPLGQANSNSPIPAHHHSHNHVVHDSDIEDELHSDSVEYVVMHNESGPLGIHVVPDYDRLGKDRGLLVQGIEPGGRIDRDGRLAVYDRIIEINGKNLLNMPFQRVQEIFKGSLLSPELRLRVIKHRSAPELLKKPPAPVFPRSITRTLDDREPVAMVEGEERLVSMSTKVATVSPTKKVSPAHPAPRPTTSLLTANTRKIGKKMELELTKGPHGLGFSITTRDNPAGGNCPIYIKNILPKGAAVEDGRLKPGDRLLEVNGVEMTGKTQAEAVTVLRNAPPGSKVRIVVSRQEDGGGSPRLPRQIVPQASPEGRTTSPETQTGRGQVQRDGSQESLEARTTFEPPEKANDDGLVFPWKHKEIFTFDIPVHDTEKAGLGVSVKGKTSASHSSSHGLSHGNSLASIDLGIFVKSVLHGGAASRDGRLRTNDQLLNVNGISLLAQSNSDAMETLRRAMLHTEGPIPGVITLTIARRGGSPGLSNGHHPHSHSSGRDSVSSLLTSSSGAETFGGKSEGDAYTPDNSGASENSDNTVIFLPYISKEDESRDSSSASHKSTSKLGDIKGLCSVESVSSRNPVIDRLTGQIANQHALRNESYYRATNETWNTTLMLSGTTSDKLSSPTVNQPSGEMVLIEEEYMPHNIPAPQHNHRMGKPRSEKSLATKRNDVETNGRPGKEVPLDQGSDTHGVDITYASQLSLEEAAAGFSRDAFGRQSMSEKRHATLDAKHTDTYQRNKKLREERERQRHMQLQQQQLNERKRAEYGPEAKQNRELMVRANSIESIISLTRSQADSERSDTRGRNEFGPALGMKKSSSLESLQTMVQEIQMQEECDPAYTYRNAQGAVRVIRGRGCNESFRAAVDRSYDAPLAELRSRMEMETHERQAWARLFPHTVAEEEPGPTECQGTGVGDGRASFGGVRGGPRQSSLNAVLDSKHKASKKKPGLLRGIGSMFRFGKHRKTLDGPLHLALHAENEGGDGGGGGGGGGIGTGEEHDGEREAARRAAQEEQQRIQEQYRRLMQRQRQLENNNQNANHPQPQPHNHGSSNGSSDGGSMGSILPANVHHREGSTSSSSGGPGPGGPPTQSRTERIHQLRAQHQRRHAERRGQYPLDDREERYEEVIRQRLEQPDASHGRAASYDLYGEMARPGSRVGITDPAKFSHYVNYEEIQQHLNRRQQHYHSQRRDNRELHQRPVSNFYEYESVQTVIRTGPQQRGVLGPALTMDSNSNSLPRRIQQDRASSKNSNASSNGTADSGYSQQQQRQYQPSSSSNHNVNSNNTGHHRVVHTHDNQKSLLPLVHNLVPNQSHHGQSNRNNGIGTKINNVTGRPQGPFVTQVMISQQPHPQV